MLRIPIATIFLASCFLMAVPLSAADPAKEAANLVEEARKAADRMMSDPEAIKLRNALAEAEAVMIVPTISGFLVPDLEGGEAVVLAKRGDDWSAPAFYRLAREDIGYQDGVQDSRMLLVFTSPAAIADLARGRLEIAEPDIVLRPTGNRMDVAGPEGSQAGGSGPEVLAFFHAPFGAVALAGPLVLSADAAKNEGYYGAGADAQAILTGRVATPPEDTRPLRSLLRDFAITTD